MPQPHSWYVQVWGEWRGGVLTPPRHAVPTRLDTTHTFDASKKSIAGWLAPVKRHRKNGNWSYAVDSAPPLRYTAKGYRSTLPNQPGAERPNAHSGPPIARGRAWHYKLRLLLEDFRVKK